LLQVPGASLELTFQKLKTYPE